MDNFVDNVDNFLFGGSEIVTKLLHLAQNIYTLMSLFMTHLGILGQNNSQELCKLSIQLIQFNWLILAYIEHTFECRFFYILPKLIEQVFTLSK